MALGRTLGVLNRNGIPLIGGGRPVASRPLSGAQLAPELSSGAYDDTGDLMPRPGVPMGYSFPTAARNNLRVSRARTAMIAGERAKQRGYAGVQGPAELDAMNNGGPLNMPGPGIPMGMSVAPPDRQGQWQDRALRRNIQLLGESQSAADAAADDRLLAPDTPLGPTDRSPKTLTLTRPDGQTITRSYTPPPPQTAGQRARLRERHAQFMRQKANYELTRVGLPDNDATDYQAQSREQGLAQGDLGMSLAEADSQRADQFVGAQSDALRGNVDQYKQLQTENQQLRALLGRYQNGSAARPAAQPKPAAFSKGYYDSLIGANDEAGAKAYLQQFQGGGAGAAPGMTPDLSASPVEGPPLPPQLRGGVPVGFGPSASGPAPASPTAPVVTPGIPMGMGGAPQSAPGPRLPAMAVQQPPAGQQLQEYNARGGAVYVRDANGNDASMPPGMTPDGGVKYPGTGAGAGRTVTVGATTYQSQGGGNYTPISQHVASPAEQANPSAYPAGPGTASAPDPFATPRVKSAAEASRLPPGTRFYDPAGNLRTVPG